LAHVAAGWMTSFAFRAVLTELLSQLLCGHLDTTLTEVYKSAVIIR
jgi:hypothetical protein